MNKSNANINRICGTLINTIVQNMDISDIKENPVTTYNTCKYNKKFNSKLNKAIDSKLDKYRILNKGIYVSRLLEIYAEKAYYERELIYYAKYIEKIKDVSARGNLLSIRYRDNEKFNLIYEVNGCSEKIIISKGETVLEILAENGSVIKNDFPFDHGTIIYEAFKKLQDEVRYHDIIFDLMPELFTVSDLHGPYQMILQKNESMQAFRKRMSPKIEETDRYDDTTAAHRKSKLYRRKIFKEE